MSAKPRVAGVGMIPFAKPGQSEDWDVMGEKAVRLALQDAGISYDQVQQAFVGYVYGDTTAGQSVMYRVGLTGIPIINVNNACATGSTALYLARHMVESGAADCVLAVGFEQMNPGAIGAIFSDRKHVGQSGGQAMVELQGFDPAVPYAAQQFGGGGRDYQKRYGAKDETFARISVKARAHAANNPLALFRDLVTVEEVMASKALFGPITRLQSCPPTCGAAAAVIVSPAFAAKHGLTAPVEIKGQAMTTDPESSFSGASMMKVIGYDMAKESARSAYEQAGIGPEDAQVVELHDCFTANELLTYESIGLCPEGGAEQFILDGDNTYGGRFVVNPSGGLLSKGHPLGATGLAQCYELTHQLRGTADKRQVDKVTHAIQHNLGLGGACVVTVYGRA
jgi:acetyl-CoA acetyltransferase